MESWIDKAQIATMQTMTQDNRTIHPMSCKEMLMPRIKLQQQQRKQRNHAIIEQEKEEHKGSQDQQHQSYVKKKEQADLTQYISALPEIPEEMALSRDDRKQLAEIMPEYTPKKSSRELSRQEETKPGKKEIGILQLQTTLQNASRNNYPY